MDEFIEHWHLRTHAALAEALAYLATLERAPISDGQLLAWIDVLCALRFEPADVPALLALIGRSDPHLQEAGIRLATAALRTVAAAQPVAVAIATTIATGVDPWVLEAIVDLLERARASLELLYPILVRLHGTTPRAPGIMRNRHIQPWGRLVSFYEQRALQTLAPSANELAFLPLLETRHETRGWRPTVKAILVAMGLDPDRHFALLAKR